MTMVPLGGLLSSTAGVPLSQTAGSETERSQKESLSQIRQADAAQHGETAAGVGQTDKGQETSDRDADGRRLWEAQRQTLSRPRYHQTPRLTRGKARTRLGNRGRSSI